MPRNRKPATPTQSAAEATIDWFKSSDADATECDNWDIKPQATIDAILGLLASGRGVMFGRSYAGDSLSITVYDGESKKRVWVTDSIEWDDAMSAICERLASMNKGDGRAKLRAIGD